MSSELVSLRAESANKNEAKRICRHVGRGESSLVCSGVAPRSHAAQRLQEGPASRAVPTALRLRRPRHERRVPHHHGPQGGEGLCAQSLHVSQRRLLVNTAVQRAKKTALSFLHQSSVLLFFLGGGGESLVLGRESVSASVLRDH